MTMTMNNTATIENSIKVKREGNMKIWSSYDNSDDMINAFKDVFETALTLINEDDMREYLYNEFQENYEDFCKFVGFCRVALNQLGSVNNQSIINFSLALTMSGLLIGRYSRYRELNFSTDDFISINEKYVEAV